MTSLAEADQQQQIASERIRCTTCLAYRELNPADADYLRQMIADTRNKTGVHISRTLGAIGVHVAAESIQRHRRFDHETRP